MDWYKKAWNKIRGSIKARSSGSPGARFGVYEPGVPIRARQKSILVLRDLIFVFVIFAIAFVLSSVLDLHNSFEAASIQLKDSPFQYDELIVALAILAAALSVFAMRRWRELENEIVERVEVEQALVDSEERYRTLAEAAQDLIFIVDRDGAVRYMNSYAAAKLGRRPEDFIGRPLDEVFPIEMSGGPGLNLKSVYENGQPLYVENMALFDGEESWLSTSLVPISDDAGRFDKVLGISRDITERKQAEESLQKTKDHLEVMVVERTSELNSLNQRLTLELDEKKLAQERLQAVNRALRTTMAAHQALTGASRESDLLLELCKAVVEVGGYRFAWVGFAGTAESREVEPVASAGYENGYLDAVKINWGNDNELGGGPVGKAIRSGAPSVVRDVLVDEGYAPWRPEALSRGFASMVSLPLSHDGEVFGALNIYAAEPDAFDAEEVKLLSELAGNLSYGLIAIRTRGERDQQAVALRRTGEQLSLLLESLPIIFYTSMATEDYGVTYVSNNVSTFTGYKPEDLTGDPEFWMDHVHPDDAPHAFEEIPKVFQKGFHEYEYRWRSADGSYKWFLDILRLVKTPEGEEDYIVGMWLDITARKHGEERLLEVKDHLEKEARAKTLELKETVERLEVAARELELRRRQSEVLGQMDGLLQSCVTVEEAYMAFGRFASELAEGSSGSLYILDEVSRRYKAVAVWGAAPPTEKSFTVEDCWSLRLGQPHVYAGNGAGMRCRHAASDVTNICVPIRAAGATFGVLVLMPPSDGEPDEDMAERMKELAATLAAHVSMAVYNVSMRQAANVDRKEGIGATARKGTNQLN